MIALFAARPPHAPAAPARRYLLSVNQEGERGVLVYRIDGRSGRLTRTQFVTHTDQPAFVHVLGGLPIRR